MTVPDIFSAKELFLEKKKDYPLWRDDNKKKHRQGRTYRSKEAAYNLVEEIVNHINNSNKSYLKRF